MLHQSLRDATPGEVEFTFGAPVDLVSVYSPSGTDEEPVLHDHRSRRKIKGTMRATNPGLGPSNASIGL